MKKSNTSTKEENNEHGNGLSALSTIKPQLVELLEQTTSKLTGTGDDIFLITDALANLQKFEIITWVDRHEVLTAFISLSDIIFEQFNEDEEFNDLLEARNKIAEVINSTFTEDALYMKLLLIINNLSTKIMGQPNGDQALEVAIGEVAELQIDQSEQSVLLVTKCMYQIISLKLLNDWYKTYSPDAKIENQIDETFIGLINYCMLYGFNKAEILTTFQTVVDLNEKHSFDYALYTETLIRIYALGLYIYPEAMPALESIEDQVLELAGAYFIQKSSEAHSDSINQPEIKSSKEIIDELRNMFETDGFSEYALNQAIIELKKLPRDTAEEFEILNQGFLDVFDLGIEYGDEEASDSLRVGKESYLKFAELKSSKPERLTAAQIIGLSEQNIEALKQNLEKGESPSVAITRAFTTFQYLMPQLPHGEPDGEKALKVLLNHMLVDFFEIITDYVPEEKLAVWKEATKTLGFLTEAIEMPTDNKVEEAVYSKRFEEQTERMINASLNLPISKEAESLNHIKQFLDLFPGLATRFILDDIDDDSIDKKELERIKSDLDSTLKLLGSAYTLDQFMENQKISLRRMSIELNQFERRRYVMIAKPAFPANKIMLDPNRVFFSGTGVVANEVVNALNTIGMVISTKRSVSSSLHSRWEQMRESAIAIFDYSNYNPAKADSQEINPDSAIEREVLETASPVANVAYENGWAYVLGKPIVILAKKGNPLPFDIDIDPVILEGDEKDGERIVSAIQTALYGVNRNAKGSCLIQTANYMQTFYSSVNDEKVQSLLPILSNTSDATKFRLAVETIIDRIDEENQMVIMPAFPGGYPDQSKKTVFHVTAFRKWSKPLEEELKKICYSKGLEYKIGYEQLNPEILPSIWKDISEASYVIADITNLNPNAVLELAMAQAFGTPILILSQNKNIHEFFYPIQKTRTHFYNPTESKKELVTLLDSFFKC